MAGIAFPTCVSVNNCICHFSPLKSDPDKELADGDVVKMYVLNFLLHVLCRYINWMNSHTFNALYRMEGGFWQVVNLNKIFPLSPSPTPPISLILYFDHSIILIIQLCINLGKIKSILIDCNIFIYYFYRDLGAQIDGYIAVIAHTLVVGASKVSCIFCSLDNFFIQHLFCHEM